VKRPTGVTILAILALIGGVIGIFGALALFLAYGVVVSGAAATAGVSAQITQSSTILLVLAIYLLVVSVLDIVVGIGAFMLKGWAWTLGIVLEVLSILYVIVNAATGGGFGFGSVVSVLIAAVILFYLFQPNVRVAFGKAA
jgi:hypothetical protein